MPKELIFCYSIHMADVIIIRGPLGVGKTTVATQLAEDLSAKYFSIDQILADHKLDEAYDNIPIDNFLEVNKILEPKIKKALQQGLSVVLDGNFYYQGAIDDLQERLGQAPKIFYLTCPLEVCVARDAARGNSLGQMACRAVFNLVSQVKTGYQIKANENDKESILQEIKKNL